MDRLSYDSLTPRERECLRLARDLPTKEIARLTALTPNTVDTYIRRATEKLGVNRRQAARLIAEFESGILAPARDFPPSQALISQPPRLSPDAADDDDGEADWPKRSIRQHDAVHETRMPFDFGDATRMTDRVGIDDDPGPSDRTIRSILCIAAIAVLIMLLIIGSVPMADSMGRIGSLIYPH